MSIDALPNNEKYPITRLHEVMVMLNKKQVEYSMENITIAKKKYKIQMLR